MEARELMSLRRMLRKYGTLTVIQNLQVIVNNIATVDYAENKGAIIHHYNRELTACADRMQWDLFVRMTQGVAALKRHQEKSQ